MQNIDGSCDWNILQFVKKKMKEFTLKIIQIYKQNTNVLKTGKNNTEKNLAHV